MGSGGSKPVKKATKGSVSRQATLSTAKRPTEGGDGVRQGKSGSERPVDHGGSDEAEAALRRRFHEFDPEEIEGVWTATFEAVCSLVGLDEPQTSSDHATRLDLFHLFSSLQGGSSNEGRPEEYSPGLTVTIDEFVQGIVRWRAAVMAPTAGPLYTECLNVVMVGDAERVTPNTVQRMARQTFGTSTLPPDCPDPVSLLTNVSASTDGVATDGTRGSAVERDDFCEWLDREISSEDVAAMRQAFVDVITGSTGTLNDSVAE
jgi:hypothetical protein